MITGLKAEESLKINNWKEPQVVFHLAIKRTSIQQKYSIPGDKKLQGQLIPYYLSYATLPMAHLQFPLLVFLKYSYVQFYTTVPTEEE